MGTDVEASSGTVRHASNVNRQLDYLPADPAEYAAVEKRLVRRIDFTLLPVLIVMIVLKYITQSTRYQRWFID